jgi:hypothetical protein
MGKRKNHSARLRRAAEETTVANESEANAADIFLRYARALHGKKVGGGVDTNLVDQAVKMTLDNLLAIMNTAMGDARRLLIEDVGRRNYFGANGNISPTLVEAITLGKAISATGADKGKRHSKIKGTKGKPRPYYLRPTP